MPIAIRMMILLSLAGGFACEVLASECPLETGQTIGIQAAPDVWALLYGFQLEKDEFETSAEFTARMEAARKHFERVFTVATTYDPAHAVYDADRQAFVITIYAWDNLNDGANRREALLNGEVLPEVSSTQRAAIGLQVEEHVEGEYTAQSAGGATVTVTKIRRERYSVFDDVLPVRSDGSFWRTETALPHSTGTIEYETPAVLLPVAVAEARTLKTEMQIAAVIRPKAPYIAITGRDWPPRFDRPTEIASTTRILIADILCAVITDPDGRILKVVRTWAP